jgi:hypothetical protein
MVVTAQSPLRVRRGRVQSALTDLLGKDEPTRLLSGEQRKEVGAILASLAAAHGELWMSGGSGERAREDIEAGVHAATTLSVSTRVHRQTRQVLASAAAEIREAGRLLGNRPLIGRPHLAREAAPLDRCA